MSGKWKRYPAYRESGVEWLGPIPEHWRSLKIKRLALVKRGASPRPIDDPIYFSDSGSYAWVRISDVTASNKYLCETEERLSSLGQSKSVALEPGEIFVSIAATVGKPIITKIRCCIHDGFVYFVGLKENREFLYWLFSSGGLYKGLGKQGTQLNLNTDTIGDIRVPVPAQQEQHAIAAFLDRGTAKIDALVAKKQRLIELLQEKRTALISHAVTRGLNPNAPLRDSGFPWIGQIPEHWEVKPLKRAVSYVEGPGIMAADFTNEGTPLLRISCIGGRRATLDGCNHVSAQLAATKWSHFRLKMHDLLISGSASTGFCSEVDVETVGSIPYTGIIMIRPTSGSANRHFIRWFFLSGLFLDQSALAKTGSTIQHFGPTHLARMLVVLPQLAEQASIAAQLDTETSKLDALMAKVRTAIDRLQEYRTALISAAVTGQIDVREEVRP